MRIFIADIRRKAGLQILLTMALFYPGTSGAVVIDGNVQDSEYDYVYDVSMEGIKDKDGKIYTTGQVGGFRLGLKQDGNMLFVGFVQPTSINDNNYGPKDGPGGEGFLRNGWGNKDGTGSSPSATLTEVGGTDTRTLAVKSHTYDNLTGSDNFVGSIKVGSTDRGTFAHDYTAKYNDGGTYNTSLGYNFENYSLLYNTMNSAETTGDGTFEAGPEGGPALIDQPLFNVMYEFKVTLDNAVALDFSGSEIPDWFIIDDNHTSPSKYGTVTWRNPEGKLVPIPAAFVLFSSALLGLVGMRRRSNR